MRESSRHRFDALYAEAVLAAYYQRAGSYDCVEAFKSQRTDPGVRRAFFDDFYPKLDPGLKALADKLAADPPPGNP